MRDASGRPPRSSAAALRKQFMQRINAAPIGESANSKRRSRQAGTKMKTTAIRSPAGSDDPPTRLSSPQQSFLAEVSRYGISHTTFELAPAMIPMPSFAVWRTVFMRDLAHAGLPDIAATHAIGELVKLGTLEQRRTRDTARPLPVYRLPECFCTRSILGLSASLQGAQHGFRMSGERRNARAAWLAFKNYRGAGTYRRAQPSNKP